MRGFFVFGFILVLAGCGDPLADVGRLSDFDVDAAAATSAAVPSEKEIQREAFFGTDAATGEAARSAGESDPKRNDGILGALFGSGASARPTATPSPSDGNLKLAAMAPDAQGGRRGGAAVSGRGIARTGPDARDVTFGTVLPFGMIARVCDAKGHKLGTKIDQSSRRGFALYDSVPGLLTKRTYYLTGFSDGCARQFTAANALLGAPSTYERFRFGPAGTHMPYAATDAAYDKVKSRSCGARKSKPCGKKISRMDRTTAFVSAYEFNEHNGRWKEFLAHDGKVVAAALKTLN